MLISIRRSSRDISFFWVYATRFLRITARWVLKAFKKIVFYQERGGEGERERGTERDINIERD